MSEASCIVRRLSRFVDLTEREAAFIAHIEADERALRTGDPVLDPEATEGLFVLNQGWAIASANRRGGRQIFRIYLPGEIIGLAEIGGDFTGQKLTMWTDGRVCPLPKHRIADALVHTPRLAALFIALSGLDQIALRDRLAAAYGDTSEARLLLLLLDLRSRLKVATVDTGNRFRMPLTQAEIGQAIGTTSVTVNKLLKSFVERGWLEIERPYYRLLAPEEMEAAVNYVDRFEQLDQSWFPPAV